MARDNLRARLFEHGHTLLPFRLVQVSAPVGVQAARSFRYLAAEFKSCSQAGQDRFVYELLIRTKLQTAGTFLDIGSGHPSRNNNTIALERLGWSGLLVDMSERVGQMAHNLRKNPFLCADASKMNWEEQRKLCSHLIPPIVDYLSLDVDADTLVTLRTLPLPRVRFRVITIEHDAYRHGDGPRAAMREILTTHDYDLVCKDVRFNGRPFEDWWVDPALVNIDVANRYRGEQREWEQIFSEAELRATHARA